MTRVGDVPSLSRFRRIIIKAIVEVSFPHEPFNSYVRAGTVGKKIEEIMQEIHPEVVYFTDNGVGRGLLMIVDLPDASHAPHVTEPLMLEFNASVHYRFAMAPEDLAKAGLEKYATD